MYLVLIVMMISVVLAAFTQGYDCHKGMVLCKGSFERHKL